MFKINKTTKYTVLALSFALAFLVGGFNTVLAGSSDDFYVGIGWGDVTTYYQDTSYDQSSYYQTPYYEPTNYYQQPSSNYYYGSYDYGCTSCGYSYQSVPQITYVPNTYTGCTTGCYTPPVIPPTPPTPPAPSLDASCVISPNSVNINDSVTISASASGGLGSYQYYWSGSDGISGSSQVITGRFTSVGNKTVSLTVTSGSQTVTRTCNAYVNQPYRYNDYNYNYNYGYNYNNLTATCSASPSNVNVGENIVWTVYATGGNGSYSYSWTGTDGLSYGNAYQVQQRYTTPGTKTATVTVYSTNGQPITVSCNANVAGTINSGTPISGIYLNEIPATGISFNLKVALYTLGLLMWSAFVGFMLVSRRKNRLALANRSKIEDFKLENMKRKNLI